jgi:hypothetical protein
MCLQGRINRLKELQFIDIWSNMVRNGVKWVIMPFCYPIVIIFPPYLLDKFSLIWYRKHIKTYKKPQIPGKNGAVRNLFLYYLYSISIGALHVGE